jgi:formylglycine-generating enzyme required for sulfatase activity
MMHLHSGALLQKGRYKIEKMLGQGGFGITYLAVQTGLNRRVAIKEFFMKELCNRDATTSYVSVPSMGSQEQVFRFKHKFLKEAQTIASFDHPGIVRIHDIFEENGTAYYVMEYLDGGSLDSRIPAVGMREAEALRVIRQAGNALSYIHNQNVLHLDVKPSNIMFRQNGAAVLIDFGISKRYDDAGGQTSSTPAGLSKGYAPLEQYNQGVQTFQPATDVYSLGATLYKMLTGQTPPECSVVNEEGLPPRPAHVRPALWNAIRQAMQPRRKDRPQHVEDFLQLLENEAATSSAESTAIPSTKPSRSQGDGDTLTKDDLLQSSSQKQPAPKPKSQFPWKTLLWSLSGIAAIVLVFLLVKNLPPSSSDSSTDWSTANSSSPILDQIESGMVYVDGGTFMMGGTSEQGSDAYDWEKPTHSVSLSSYYISDHEVTQAEWEAVMGTTVRQQRDKVDSSSAIYGEGPDYPMCYISWDDCQEFIRKLNSQTGKNYRLPTEAEWEYAARGGSKSRGYKYSGSNTLGDVAWYWQNSGDHFLSGTDDDWDWDTIENNHGQSHPVKQKPSNELGLYDMSGNVREWCQDWYGVYTTDSASNPTGPASGSRRVIRGGCWGDDAKNCRVSFRSGNSPSDRYGDLGLRLAR